MKNRISLTFLVSENSNLDQIIWSLITLRILLAVNPPQKRGSISSLASMTIPNSNFTSKMMASEARAKTIEDAYLDQAPNFIIHPYSNFRIFWDLTTFALVTLNLVIIPMNIAFYSELDTFDNFFLVSDLWFLTDILLNLR